MHRRAHIAKEPKTRVDPKLVMIAVGSDWRAVHIFHDKKRELLVGKAAVEQLRNAAVLERRKDLPLGDKATV